MTVRNVWILIDDSDANEGGRCEECRSFVDIPDELSVVVRNNRSRDKVGTSFMFKVWN